MAKQFYSTLTKEFYDTEKKCDEAEELFNKKELEKKLKEEQEKKKRDEKLKALDDDIEVKKKALDSAYTAYKEAHTKYKEAYDAYENALESKAYFNTDCSDSFANNVKSLDDILDMFGFLV